MSSRVKYKTFPVEVIEKFRALKDELIGILLEMENYKTAKEEYRRSLKTLENVYRERIVGCSIDQYSAYLPYNNVLYSYVLYAMVPSLLARRVFIRPSFYSAQTALNIHRLIGDDFSQKISIQEWSRREFVRKFVRNSNAVAFTGKYTHLPEITRYIQPGQLLIYGGDGLVSFVVGEDADIPQSVKGAIADRLYASGQDCICPDVFLVHSSVKDLFLDDLIREVSNLKFGERQDRNADYSPILKDDVLTGVKDFLSCRKDRIIYGKGVDVENRVVHPTIVLEKYLVDYNFFEFYSPVFRVYLYDNNEQLQRFYEAALLQPLKMGVSVFGNETIAKYLEAKKYVVAHNKTFFDIEDGNAPFGGYGVHSSHIQFLGKVEARPVLVSQEIQQYLGSSCDSEVGLS